MTRTRRLLRETFPSEFARGLGWLLLITLSSLWPSSPSRAQDSKSGYQLLVRGTSGRWNMVVRSPWMGGSAEQIRSLLGRTKNQNKHLDGLLLRVGSRDN